MNRLRNILILLLLSFSFGTIAQEGVGIGNWRTHMPYDNIVDVELLGTKAYAATQYELFTFDTEDGSKQVLNKINALSDIGISTIRRNEKLNLLVVAYTNGNIDLIDTQGEVFNMSDIKDKNLLVDKTINNVVFKDHLAYVACGFGIVVFDLNRKEVKDTYYIGENGSAVNVTDIAFYNGKIYASTKDGLYYANEDDANLANFSSWSFDNSLIHPHLQYNEMEVFADKLFLNFNNSVVGGDTLFIFDGDRWDYFDTTFTIDKRELRASEDALLISCINCVVVYNQELQQTAVLKAIGGYVYPSSSVKDPNGSIWIGDRKRGLINTFINGNYTDNLSPNGTYTNKVFQLNAFGKHVWISTGGHYPNWAPKYDTYGVCHFDGNWWTNLNANSVAGLGKKDDFNGELFADFVCCTTDPKDPSVTYVGSWGHGLLKFKDNDFVDKFNPNTEGCSLQPWNTSQRYVIVSGLAFDSKGNLWVANSGANNLLSAMDRNGVWRSFYLGGSNSSIDIGSMIIDKNDYKWIIRRSGNDDKIIVFNDNGTLDNPDDDEVVTLRCVSGHGGLSGSSVNCVAVDRDGYVWVGTDSGPCYFSDTKKLFEHGSYDASVVLVPRNDGTDQADPLFNEVRVLSIAVDGKNNKWFGLESGVYQMSPDCRTEMLHFDTDNSPLLDNSVNTMAINDDGEVFFGTDLGVISFKGFATPGGQTNTEVTVYPNPVRPGFSGYVGIKGLVEDALVRITTVDGSFVTELVADGGQAVWDCTTIDGRKVLPGIYLVFISTKDGNEKYATKILIMN